MSFTKSFLLAFGLAACLASAQTVTVKSGGAKVRVRTQSVAAVKVTVNGEAVVFSGSPPIMVRGRVMVPMRGVFEQMGAEVEWKPAEKLVIATKADAKVECWIGRTFAEINDEQVKLDAPPMLLNGRALVPLRFISEALGADVSWDAPSSTVVIRIERS